MKVNYAVFLVIFLIGLCRVPFYGENQRCGTPATQFVAADPNYAITEDITIPVIFHVIYASDGTGNVLDSQITLQIDWLNAAYNVNNTFEGDLPPPCLAHPIIPFA